MGKQELDLLRKIALALPQVNERRGAGGATCFFIRGKHRQTLCYYHDDRRGDGRASVWCPADSDFQEMLVFTNPTKFFKPATSSSGAFKNWIGIVLDATDKDQTDWSEVADILKRAFRKAAPKNLVCALDG
ncbi:MAG: MmcQ/YjbR family DNA-binding protein [Alphaproteobacteria bacterium]|nr:MmcQ/YjbR family DNA-binding protein [Alphaproteobacteria bacterium]